MNNNVLIISIWISQLFQDKAQHTGNDDAVSKSFIEFDLVQPSSRSLASSPKNKKKGSDGSPSNNGSRIASHQEQHRRIRIEKRESIIQTLISQGIIIQVYNNYLFIHIINKYYPLVFLFLYSSTYY